MPSINQDSSISPDNKENVTTSQIIEELPDEDNDFIIITFNNNTPQEKIEEQKQSSSLPKEIIIPSTEIIIPTLENETKEQPSSFFKESLNLVQETSSSTTENTTKEKSSSLLKDSLGLFQETASPTTEKITKEKLSSFLKDSFPPFPEIFSPATEEKNIHRIVDILKKESNRLNDKSVNLSIQIEAMPLNNDELQTIFLQKIESPIAIKEENNQESSSKQRIQPDRKKSNTLHITLPKKNSYSIKKIWEMSLTLFCCCPKKRNHLDTHKKNDDSARPANLPPSLTT